MPAPPRMRYNCDFYGESVSFRGMKSQILVLCLDLGGNLEIKKNFQQNPSLNTLDMDEGRIKRKLYNALKLSGFTVRRELCDLLVEKFIEEDFDLEDKSAFENLVKKLCESLENQCLAEKSIDQEHIDRAIEVCLRSGYDRNESVFNIINAFEFPKLEYNLDRKQYYIDKNKSKILPDANVKSKLFWDRYSTILQRTKRNFQMKVDTEADKLTLQTVDYLLTLSYVTLDRTLILGSLIQVSEGKYFLEDPTGMVELDLAHAKYHGGFFVETSFILANGYYEDRILHVSTFVLPPGEEYMKSRPSFGNLNYFGGPSNTPLRDSLKLRDHMRENKENIILFFPTYGSIILFNCVRSMNHNWYIIHQAHYMGSMLLFVFLFLGKPSLEIFNKLEYLFEGLQDMPPIAFVFMGNFISNSHGSEMMDTLRQLLKKLADLILKFPGLLASEFVFVPGMSDPCTPHIVPRFGLPNYVTSEMKRLIPKAIFATNPCRLQYCTREIVIFRADLVGKFLQGTLHKSSKEEIAGCLRKTIISQGHLSPLPLNSLTVHWDFDYCLRLYPLPDLIVVGDKAESFQGSYKECQVLNPGSFCDGGFQFWQYKPFDNTLDDCALDS